MNNTLGIGIVGLGRAATSLVPSILSHPNVHIAALCEPQTALREVFCADHRVTGYSNIERLCADDAVDVVYVATPHQFHRDHALVALSHGKHVLVEKPMALRLDECDEMIDATNHAGKVLLVGHTNGYDAPIVELRKITQSMRFGRLRMLNTFNYSDFLYRPRRPEELDTKLGGGIMYNQFPHQVEIVRTIADARAVSITAVCGNWDEFRPTEGAVCALIRFAGEVTATIVYSGYAHLDGRSFFSGIDGSTNSKSFAGLRESILKMTPQYEAEQKAQSGYLSRRLEVINGVETSKQHQRFGVVVAGFEQADVVQSPTGLIAYTDDGAEPIEVPFGTGGGQRATVIDELITAISGNSAIHDGPWARETLSICLAALQSSQDGSEVRISP